MKHTLAKTILAILLLTSTQVPAQTNKKTIDLIPYKKGKLWGLVHHDKSPFYPAVLDSIIVEPKYREMFEVFKDHDKLGPVADVIYKGKRMWLTQDKKIVEKEGDQLDEARSDKYTTASAGIFEENTERIRIEVAEEDKPVDLIDTIYQGKDEIQIKRQNGAVYFYINNKELPEFRCSDYEQYTDKNGSDYYILNDQRTKTTAMASLAQRRLISPFEYDHLFKCGDADYFIAWKDKQAGLINTEGAVVLPVKYQYLIYKCNDSLNKLIYLVSSPDWKQFSLVTVKDGKAKVSPVAYSAFHGHGTRGSMYYFIVSKGEVKGIVNADGKVLLPFEYTDIFREFDNDFLITKKDKKYGFVNPWKFFVRDAVYDDMSGPMKTYFTIGNSPCYLFKVKKNGKTFYIDNFGTEFIAP